MPNRFFGRKPPPVLATTFNFSSIDLEENVESGANANYPLQGVFSRAIFNNVQGATSVDITVYSSIFGTNPDLSHAFVRKDGVDAETLTPTVTGNNTFTVNLSGVSELEIVSGTQDDTNGTFLKSAVFNQQVAFKEWRPAEVWLILGDSIAAGWRASVPPKTGWIPLLRALRANRSLIMHGYAGLTLHTVASNASLRSALVAKIAAQYPDKIYLALGTNDYGLEPWNAANFGAAYAALLDELKVKLPQIQIFCQTPLVRSSEAANGWGNTLGNYRTQIANAQSARSGYCTLVDGTAILSLPGDFNADGLHPNDTGHAAYAAFVNGLG